MSVIDLSENYQGWIGRKVFKKSGRPFKSGLKQNTVFGIGIHAEISQIKHYPVFGFIFVEDTSCVACHICELVEDEDEQQ